MSPSGAFIVETRWLSVWVPIILRRTPRCDTCQTEIIDRCHRCGAPQCCPKCCAEEYARLLRHKN